ncbi:MAG: hypothetical protein LBD62_04305 [Candidatus Margulisbacteria bacterium]|jgi:hypothetical protein|nr:hypothetical protein [Candidatus Margulisiibacteriota bacterium]
MALPIKETPVLTGKDAERFLRIIEANEKKSLSKEEAFSIKKAYDMFTFRGK